MVAQAIVMFSGVLVIALVYYYVHGRHVYEGPVVFVEGRRPVERT